MSLENIYKKASLVMKPAAMKEGKLYSQQPHSGDGDFTFSRANGAQTRINKNGLIESVADNTPRLSYELDADGNVSECPTLLLEPTRTNKLLYSEDYSQSSWSKVNTTATDNQIIAPNGSLTGGRVQRTSTDASYFQQVLSESLSGYYYSISIWVKKGNSDRVALRLQTNYPDRYDVRFVFSTESVELDQVYGDLTDGSCNVVKYPNDWYRIEVTVKTASDNTQVRLTLSPRVSTGDIDSVDTSSDAFCYIWGAQLETSGDTSGGYSTSYIPTAGSEVQRTADTCNTANYANLPTDYPLTVYWKGQVKEFNGFNCAFSIYKDGASGEFLTVSFNTASEILVRRAFGGSEDVDFINYSYSIGDILKIGIKFTSATTFKLFINGSEIYEETSGTSKTWDFNSILIGQLRIAADIGNRNPCNELMIFNEALSDAELIELTS